jgi:hypothetical protein
MASENHIGWGVRICTGNFRMDGDSVYRKGVQDSVGNVKRCVNTRSRDISCVRYTVSKWVGASVYVIICASQGSHATGLKEGFVPHLCFAEKGSGAP